MKFAIFGLGVVLGVQDHKNIKFPMMSILANVALKGLKSTLAAIAYF